MWAKLNHGATGAAMQKVFGAVALIWDWTARLIVAFLGLIALVASATVTTTDFWFLAPVVFAIGLYFTVTPFAPRSSARAMGWIGRRLSRPYNWLVQKVVEPIEAGADVVGPILERIITFSVRSALWIVAIALVLIIGLLLIWFAFQTIAAVPVSVAVIIGAVIIAGAVYSRR